MLQDTGQRLARYVLQANLSNNEILTKRLSDYLPASLGLDEPGLDAVRLVCAEIPVYCLQYSPISHDDFTAAIYHLLDKLPIPFEDHGEVLSFFRSFCKEFFMPGPHGEWSDAPHPRPVMGRPRQTEEDHSQAEAAELSRILATRARLWEQVDLQQAAEIPVNFNDLLAILQDAYSRGELQRVVEKEEPGGDADYLYTAFMKVIGAMTGEERLDPTLLLEHYDSVRRYRRRARIAAQAQISLSLVDHCLAALAEFRRNYQLYLQRSIRP